VESWRADPIWKTYRIAWIRFIKKNEGRFLSPQVMHLSGKCIGTSNATNRTKIWFRNTWPRIREQIEISKQISSEKDEGTPNYYQMFDLRKSFSDRVSPRSTDKALRKERKGKERPIL